MRVIFEEVDHEYFFELVLSPQDFEQIETFGGIIKDCVWEGNGIKDINVFIRKEKENKLCHSLKEKKHQAEKGSLKILKEKCTKGSHKSKQSLSLIPKRAEGKRKLPKKVKNKEAT